MLWQPPATTTSTGGHTDTTHDHIIAALFIAATSRAAFSTPTYAAGRDCGAFNNQAEAQCFYVNQGGPRSDPHRLDVDVARAIRC